MNPTLEALKAIIDGWYGMSRAEIYNAIYAALQAEQGQSWHEMHPAANARHLTEVKAKDLVSRGHLVEGYIMRKDSDKTYPMCLMYGSAVRWMNDEQLYSVMHNLQATPPAEQWVSVKDRLPVQEGNCLVYPFPSDYCVEARLCFDGQWRYVEYETGFGEVHHVCSVTHWMPFPTLPPIDSTDAGDQHE